MRALPIATLAAAVLGLAACGGSGAPGSAAGGTSTPASSQTGSPNQAAAYTLSTASVPPLGTVLVNGSGRTLYVLSSEKGGRITCTGANGCTGVWPGTELPAGIRAGVAQSGVQASLLGTTMAADGKLYLTYAGYPLYTYSGDTGPGQAHGQGIHSFGGTWWVMAADGQPVTSSSSPAYSGGGSGY
ncbi:MAG: COG4315 family predicted lipoprotein [Candidatus Dormibacteria bacterium]